MATDTGTYSIHPGKVAVATTRNPSGCQNDLFAWVEATVGAGSNGKPPLSSLSASRLIAGHRDGATAPHGKAHCRE